MRKWEAIARISLVMSALVILAMVILQFARGHFLTGLLLGFILAIEIGMVRIGWYAIAHKKVIELLERIARWMIAEDKATKQEDMAIKPEAQNHRTELPPWEKIPDHLWDRVAVRLWWEGHLAKEIANAVRTTPERVTNRLSELRRQYGPEIVPYDKDRRKK